MDITKNITEQQAACEFSLAWSGEGIHLHFNKESLVEVICMPHELAQIIGNDELSENVECFLVQEIPVSSLHAALIVGFSEFRQDASNQTLDKWLNEQLFVQLHSGLEVLSGLLGDQLPNNLVQLHHELELSQRLQSDIAAANEDLARREGREPLSAVALKNAISDDEKDKGFRIVSSTNVEVWGQHTNYGLVYDEKVLLEVELDPVSIARLLGIPSQSPETIEMLIQMYEYPLTGIEAHLFASLAAYVCDESNVGREDIFEAWSVLTFEEKMHSGFELLSQVLGRTNAAQTCPIMANWSELSEIKRERQKIHEDFVQSLGDEPQEASTQHSSTQDL